MNQAPNQSINQAMHQNSGDSNGFSNGAPGSLPQGRSPRAPWTMLAWMLALSPAATVVVARLMLGTSSIGPSVAHAAEEVATLPSVPRVAMNDQAKLRTAASAQDLTPTLPWIRATAATGPTEPPSRGTVEVPPPEFSVTSIMVARGETIAVVQGKLRRIGDLPVAGWQIAQIDADAGTVTFAHQDGRRAVVALRNREPK